MSFRFIKHIAFDIDGTMTDIERLNFIQNAIRVFLAGHNIDWDGHYEADKYWWSDKFPQIKELKLERECNAFLNRAMNRTCPITSGIPTIIMLLSQMGIEISLITKRSVEWLNDPGYTAEMLHQSTIHWMQMYGIDIDCSNLHFVHDNKLAKMNEIHADLIVEDSPDEIYSIAEEKPVIVIPRPWNENVKGKNIYRHTLFEGGIDNQAFLAMLHIIDANLASKNLRRK